MDGSTDIFLLKYFWNIWIQNKYKPPFLKGYFHNKSVVSDIQGFPNYNLWSSHLDWRMSV